MTGASDDKPHSPGDVEKSEQRYVSRGGEKLHAALDHFSFSPAGLTCADLGASVGGFTDCLLKAGAAKVFAVDTAYGQFAYKLRTDERVVVMERVNVLHVEPPVGVDFVVMDIGWTVQRKAIPAALRWLKHSPDARILTLIKPHYEAAGFGLAEELEAGVPGVLSEAAARVVVDRTLAELPSLGVELIGCVISPILGGGKRSKSAARGNHEWLALLRRADV